MRLTYLLASDTHGMHQYTADLAARCLSGGDEVHLVSTGHLPRDRYAPGIQVHTPLATRGTGFGPAGVRPRALLRLLRCSLALRPDLVHMTGPHLWNPLLVAQFRRRGIPVLHSIHDLHPHLGAIYGRLLYGWNTRIYRGADHILVHGRRWRDELLARHLEPARVTHTPLTHLFLSHSAEEQIRRSPPKIRHEPWALCIGRLLPYKGLDILAQAASALGESRPAVVVAGPGRTAGLLPQPLPAGLELRNRFIADQEAVDLFSTCGLVVLPYLEASQSALVAAAYYFHKPVLVTRAGALPEYVVEDQTGWIVPPGDAGALAAALRSALADPDRLRAMGRAGRAWYETSRLSEGETLADLYRSLAGAGYRPAGDGERR